MQEQAYVWRIPPTTEYLAFCHANPAVDLRQLSLDLLASQGLTSKLPTLIQNDEAQIAEAQEGMIHQGLATVTGCLPFTAPSTPASETERQHPCAQETPSKSTQMLNLLVPSRE